MKPILRRVQQLEHRVRAQAVAEDFSGARDILRAKIDRMAAALRASPDWKGELSPADVERVKLRLKGFLLCAGREERQ